ncbi:MAG TPA: hypothetical protein VFH68_21520 [Polyangia bacterium]|jgi:hypothetical protein|nr:hypothetical protein [Polyangia bacterium]
MSTDLSLRGTLLLAALVFPYAAEVIYQVWLQARFLAAVPPAVRASWPRHPRRPWLSFCASLRFQIAVLRYARLNLPEDTPDVAFWKRKMRASVVRESYLLVGLAVTAVVLVEFGWRPIWP